MPACHPCKFEPLPQKMAMTGSTRIRRESVHAGTETGVKTRPVIAVGCFPCGHARTPPAVFRTASAVERAPRLNLALTFPPIYLKSPLSSRNSSIYGAVVPVQYASHCRKRDSNLESSDAYITSLTKIILPSRRALHQVRVSLKLYQLLLSYFLSFCRGHLRLP